MIMKTFQGALEHLSSLKTEYHGRDPMEQSQTKRKKQNKQSKKKTESQSLMLKKEGPNPRVDYYAWGHVFPEGLIVLKKCPKCHHENQPSEAVKGVCEKCLFDMNSYAEELI